MTDGDASKEPADDWVLFWIGVVFLCLLAVCTHNLTHGAPLPKDTSKVTAAAAVTQILLSPRVPPDDRIVVLVRRRSGNSNFDRKDLAWYKSKARRGKLRGQEGPCVIDQKVDRFHRTAGRFTGGVQI